MFHPRGDRKFRLIACGAQAVGLAGIVVVPDRTHSQALMIDWFDGQDAFIKPELNPVTFGRVSSSTSSSVTDVFPGGPGWFQCCLPGAGHRRSARHGPAGLQGGARTLPRAYDRPRPRLCHRGEGALRSGERRGTGHDLAVAHRRLRARRRPAAADPGRRWSGQGHAHRLRWAVAFGCSALLLVSAIGAHRAYLVVPAVTRRVMAGAGPHATLYSSPGRPRTHSHSKRTRRCDYDRRLTT